MLSQRKKPIGLFDSGVGGLTVLRELRRALPEESFIYLGDSGRNPYGSKDSETIVRYSRECAEFLLKQGVKLLVVACNTSSALALQELELICDCPVVGTIEPAVSSALGLTHNKRVGVIGTQATVESQAYTRALHGLDSTFKIFSKSCPLFVPLVEEGMFEGKIADEIVALYLSCLKESEIDTLILGCTHYPLLVGAISRYLGEKINIIECSKAIADTTYQLLRQRDLLNNEPKVEQDRYFVTDGPERFNRLASLFLNVENIVSNRVNIP